MALAELETKTEPRALEAAQLGRFLHNQIPVIKQLEKLHDEAILVAETMSCAKDGIIEESEIAHAGAIVYDKQRSFIKPAHELSQTIAERAKGGKIKFTTGQELSSDMGVLYEENNGARTIFGDWPLTNEQAAQSWRQASMDEWNYLLTLLHVEARRYPDPQGQLFALP